MNWKYLVGKILSEIDVFIINSKLDFVNKHYPFGRNWIFDLKRTLSSEPMLIVDVGANIGSVSKELNHFFPNANIFAFEPVSSTFNLLVKNTSKISKINSQKLALGSTNEKFELSLNPENTINSLKVSNFKNSLGIEQIDVIRLDEFILQNELG
ncbi:FkbM family methyltransferase [Pedobacter frigiditerrae]|uniref:FkbM family methyltransferase n=1 Tax=Pedobacter frigiditerrae TaxID=2530452 RepID=UPI00292E58EB|nr:FkbM family methyltransferase [Pedobacter frigiditerrae]